MKMQRISVTGITTAKPRGFTLLEVLVVLIIIGMLSASVVYVMRPGDGVKFESQELVIYLSKVRDEAVFSGRAHAVSIEDGGLKALRFTGGGWADPNQVLVYHAPDRMDLSLMLNDAEFSEGISTKLPAIVFRSDGSPGSSNWHIELQNVSEGSAMVSSDLLGRLSVVYE